MLISNSLLTFFYFSTFIVASLARMLPREDPCDAAHGCGYTTITDYVSYSSISVSTSTTSYDICLVDLAASFTLYDPAKPQRTASLPPTDAPSGCKITDASQFSELYTAAASTGSLRDGFEVICAPTLSPSSAAHIVTSTMGSDNKPTEVTAYTWSWWCTTDACATVTSTQGDSTLVVSWGSGSGLHSHEILTATAREPDAAGHTWWTASEYCSEVTDRILVSQTIWSTSQVTHLSKTYFPITTTSAPAPSSATSYVYANYEQPGIINYMGLHFPGNTFMAIVAVTEGSESSVNVCGTMTATKDTFDRTIDPRPSCATCNHDGGAPCYLSVGQECSDGNTFIGGRICTDYQALPGT